MMRMVLDVRKVGCFGRARRSVSELIDLSIPQEEQLPRPMLTLMSFRGCVDFLSYHDGDDIVGVTYSLSHRGHAFVLYVAVAPGHRSKGYGSEILSHLRTRYDGIPLTLNVEPIDPSSDNNRQRERRVSFYLRNGFHDTGYELFDGPIRYTVLSTAEEFDPDSYRSVLGWLTFGYEMFRVAVASERGSPTDRETR